jgi:hypothetical protein
VARFRPARPCHWVLPAATAVTGILTQNIADSEALFAAAVEFGRI